MHRSASESAEEKKGVIIEAEMRYVFRIPLVKIEFELIIEAEVRYVCFAFHWSRYKRT